MGFIFLITLPWLVPLFWFKFVCPAARLVNKANRKKNPIAIIVHDSGRAIITMIQERRGEGVVVTDKGQYKLLPRYISEQELMAPSEAPINPLVANLLSMPAEQPTQGKPQGDGKESLPASLIQPTPKPELPPKAYKLYNDWLSKRINLIGFGQSIWFGYSGSLCLLNPDAMALWESGEMMVIGADNKPHFDEKQKSKIEKIKGIGEVLQPLMLLDPRQIKVIMNKIFDQTQIAAVVYDSEEIGRMGRGFGKYLPYLLIIVVLVIVALIGYTVLSGGI